MKCEKCLSKDASYICTRCKCGHYCSEKCQLEDWQTHKKFCKLWNKSGVFLNPFYSEQIVKYPPKFDIVDIKENDNYLSYSRGYQGETALHFAVIDGDFDKINSLIENNAYINSLDYRNNNSIYYACTHPGKNDILNNNPSLRINIVKLLMDNGADCLERGGFSGLRTYEIAKQNNLIEIYELITNHKYFKILNRIKENINNSTPPADISIVVKQWYDLFWRSRSVHWLFALGRENMNIKPHPNILNIAELIMKETDEKVKSQLIEDMFIDCQLRHKLMMTNIDKIL